MNNIDKIIGESITTDNELVRGMSIIAALLSSNNVVLTGSVVLVFDAYDIFEDSDIEVEVHCLSDEVVVKYEWSPMTVVSTGTDNRFLAITHDVTIGDAIQLRIKNCGDISTVRLSFVDDETLESTEEIQSGLLFPVTIDKHMSILTMDNNIINIIDDEITMTGNITISPIATSNSPKMLELMLADLVYNMMEHHGVNGIADALMSIKFNGEWDCSTHMTSIATEMIRDVICSLKSDTSTDGDSVITTTPTNVRLGIMDVDKGINIDVTLVGKLATKPRNYTKLSRESRMANATISQVNSDSKQTNSSDKQCQVFKTTVKNTKTVDSPTKADMTESIHDIVKFVNLGPYHVLMINDKPANSANYVYTPMNLNGVSIGDYRLTVFMTVKGYDIIVYKNNTMQNVVSVDNIIQPVKVKPEKFITMLDTIQSVIEMIHKLKV